MLDIKKVLIIKIINFFILTSFLTSHLSYGATNSDTLRPNLMGDSEAGSRRQVETAVEAILSEASETAGSVEPIVDALTAARAHRYYEACSLLLEGLLGEDFVDNIETAITVSRALLIPYNISTEEGAMIKDILDILQDPRYREAADQGEMKRELRRVTGMDELYDADYFELAILINQGLYIWEKIGTLDAYVAPDGSPIPKIKEIIEGLRVGRVVFKDRVELNVPLQRKGSFSVRLNLLRGAAHAHFEGEIFEWADGQVGRIHDVDEALLREGPPALLDLASKTLGISVDRPSMIYSGEGAWITSMAELWELWRRGLNVMTEDEIGRCLCSLGQNVPARAILKNLSVKMLGKLQQQRPETIAMIREKALELLEVDEDNYREVLEPFVSDYAAIRDVIRDLGITDDGIEFYDLFDTLAVIPEQELLETQRAIREECEQIAQGTREKVMSEFTSSRYASFHINIPITLHVLYRAMALRHLYGNFEMDFLPGYEVKDLIDTGVSEWSQDIQYRATFETVQESPSELNIVPSANLSNLRQTPVLFRDTDIVANPESFQRALGQLRSNEGNIPVIVLTEHTESSIGAILRDINLRGVEFRTLKQLGFQNIEELDGFTCLIADIDGLQCVPLTNSLAAAYKSMEEARDQV